MCNRIIQQEQYLNSTNVIDHNHTLVMKKANEIAEGCDKKLQISQACFEWVRDNIEHSIDANRAEVTCSASEVLAAGHGFCYAKSHLLAALLRANGVAAGFCYQRLTDDHNGFCLHGFNTVYLSDYGWYRIDARGNKAGVDAQFTPPHEQLAFNNDEEGEVDYKINLAEPWPTVVRVLQQADNAQRLVRNLPGKLVMG